MKLIYHNRLPHIAPVGATFFVTFRLNDSLPQYIVNELKISLNAEIELIKKEYHKDNKQLIYDVRKRYFGKFEHQLDSQRYGACILKDPEVSQILMKKIESYNESLYDLKTGKLWFKDSYDHFVRNEMEWRNIILYILRNPVKAGLVKDWTDWPNTYIKPSLYRLL